MVVSYPFVKGHDAKVRPVVVVSTSALSDNHQVFFAAPITTARGMTDVWRDDIIVTDHQEVGLPAPCVIRPSRLTTLRVNQARRRLGAITMKDRRAIVGILKRWLG